DGAPAALQLEEAVVLGRRHAVLLLDGRPVASPRGAGAAPGARAVEQRHHALTPGTPAAAVGPLRRRHARAPPLLGNPGETALRCSLLHVGWLLGQPVPRAPLAALHGGEGARLSRAAPGAS